MVPLASFSSPLFSLPQEALAAVFMAMEDYAFHKGTIECSAEDLDLCLISFPNNLEFSLAQHFTFYAIFFLAA